MNTLIDVVSAVLADRERGIAETPNAPCPCHATFGVPHAYRLHASIE